MRPRGRLLVGFAAVGRAAYDFGDRSGDHRSERCGPLAARLYYGMARDVLVRRLAIHLKWFR